MDLVLVIKKEPLAEIEAGRKTHEYREIKPHWENRIKGREYDAVLFINGYRPGAKRSRYDLKGISECLYKGKPCFDIELGEKLPLK